MIDDVFNADRMRGERTPFQDPLKKIVELKLQHQYLKERKKQFTNRDEIYKTKYYIP